jgi:hypothetical protein
LRQWLGSECAPCCMQCITLVRLCCTNPPAAATTLLHLDILFQCCLMLTRRKVSRKKTSHNIPFVQHCTLLAARLDACRPARLGQETVSLSVSRSVRAEQQSS